MAVSWQDMRDAYAADLVGGHLIAHVDGAHKKLGFFQHGVFYFTPEGEELAAKLEASVIAQAVKPRRRKPAAEDVVAATDEVTVEVAPEPEE